MCAGFWSAVGRCLILAVTVLIAGCTNYPTRNVPMTQKITDTYGYRMPDPEPAGLADTMVIVTASGGGTRASALALGALQGLDGIKLPDGRSLADEVDIISSVSGGSVTAGYFALEGAAGFGTLKEKFIRQDGMTPLIFGFFNPFGLARFSTAKAERIDLLIEYLDRTLFDKKTYEALIAHHRRPFLILNAADMVEGIPFSFTQQKMDLLCSDMSKLRLSVAVAASAAFPVALSPVNLTNYSPCEWTPNTWPPEWVTGSIDPPNAAAPSVWYLNQQRATLARAENAYAHGPDPDKKTGKAYIHLLDGGITDNLGLFEPLRMLSTNDTVPSLLERINEGTIKKLIFVVVNARSFPPSKLDQQKATPGLIDMLGASIASPIDRTTAGTAQQLRNLLFSDLRDDLEKDDPLQKVYDALFENTALISVDFDGIHDDACRQRFHSIETNWSLTDGEIDAVIEMGKALIVNDPEYERMMTILDNPPPPSDIKTVTEACNALPAKKTS